MTTEKTDQAVWRYGIISHLLHPNEEDATLQNELTRLASRSFRKPDGRAVTFSPETLRKWLYRYRHGGLPALEDSPRKSLALCGPSGSGKTTLVHALIHELDKNAYRSVLIPYAGHSRNGITRILAESLGVDTKGRGVPLIARTQQHIEAMIDGANPRHPVIVVDDAQRLENDSLWDLCSLLFQTAKPTAAASLLLVGDEIVEPYDDGRSLPLTWPDYEEPLVDV